MTNTQLEEKLENYIYLEQIITINKDHVNDEIARRIPHTLVALEKHICI